MMKLRDFVRQHDLNLKDINTVVIYDQIGQIDDYLSVEKALYYEGDAVLVNCWTQVSLFDQKDILFFLVEEMV